MTKEEQEKRLKFAKEILEGKVSLKESIKNEGVAIENCLKMLDKIEDKSNKNVRLHEASTRNDFIEQSTFKKMLKYNKKITNNRELMLFLNASVAYVGCKDPGLIRKIGFFYYFGIPVEQMKNITNELWDHELKQEILCEIASGEFWEAYGEYKLKTGNKFENDIKDNPMKAAFNLDEPKYNISQDSKNALYPMAENAMNLQVLYSKVLMHESRSDISIRGRRSISYEKNNGEYTLMLNMTKCQDKTPVEINDEINFELRKISRDIETSK